MSPSLATYIVRKILNSLKSDYAALKHSFEKCSSTIKKPLMKAPKTNLSKQGLALDELASGLRDNPSIIRVEKFSSRTDRVTERLTIYALEPQTGTTPDSSLLSIRVFHLEVTKRSCLIVDRPLGVFVVGHSLIRFLIRYYPKDIEASIARQGWDQLRASLDLSIKFAVALHQNGKIPFTSVIVPCHGGFMLGECHTLDRMDIKTRGSVQDLRNGELIPYEVPHLLWPPGAGDSMVLELKTFVSERRGKPDQMEAVGKIIDHLSRHDQTITGFLRDHVRWPVVQARPAEPDLHDILTAQPRDAIAPALKPLLPVRLELPSPGSLWTRVSGQNLENLRLDRTSSSTALCFHGF